MSTDEKNFSIENKVGGYSHCEKHSITYIWEINEITSFIRSARTTEGIVQVLSPNFSTGSKMEDSWNLKLQIPNDNESSKDKTWLSVYLHPKNGNKSIRSKDHIFFLNNKKEKVDRNFIVSDQSSDQRFDHRIYTGEAVWGYKQFVKINELLEKKEEFFPNDTLTVGIDFTVYDDYVKIDNTINSVKYSGPRLNDDFKNLLVTKKNCDVVIKVGDERFDAHKFILSARSCVFEAMFSHNMKENKENEVTIPDISPEVFKKVLDFIYTDQVDELDTAAKELLEAADKYQLQRLKETCEAFLSNTLTIENAISILILSDLHDAKQLKDLIIKYVVMNFAKFKNTEEFNALEEFRSSLFSTILKKYSDVGTK